MVVHCILDMEAEEWSIMNFGSDSMKLGHDLGFKTKEKMEDCLVSFIALGQKRSLVSIQNFAVQLYRVVEPIGIGEVRSYLTPLDSLSPTDWGLTSNPSWKDVNTMPWVETNCTLQFQWVQEMILYKMVLVQYSIIILVLNSPQSVIINPQDYSSSLLSNTSPDSIESPQWNLDFESPVSVEILSGVSNDSLLTSFHPSFGNGQF
ncbi:hypothetical protein CQW23_08477 [Capsicum baccatum]|uniref:Uncharacterized protein n=1 Tax=Capsicum baccatum TaxID=33114 RepID=A0A2G2X941_CAPBA|nr:hypothetical protein CQW23_08477 [Capsicum baccatum]